MNEFLKRKQSVNERGAVFAGDDFRRLVGGAGQVADDGFQEIVHGYYTFNRSEFIDNHSEMCSGFFEPFQYFPGFHVFGKIEWGLGKLSEISRTQQEICLEQILDKDDADDFVQFFVAQRKGGVDGFVYFFLVRFRSCFNIQPDQIHSVGHQGTYLAVAQLKNIFNDILYHFFDAADGCSFGHKRLDFIFGHLRIFRSGDAKCFDDEIGRVAQEPKDRSHE